ncbi:VOC family protein [Marinovum sp.]|uniref:VOC family protein n=1 Tax=Marinovum sp. TaxID=2024839 RepID=UPI003A8D99AA
MPKKPAVAPRGYRTCTAALAVANVPAALAFYEAAFDAKVQARDSEAEPRFATIKVGSSMLFVTEGWAGHGHQPTPGAASVAHHMYVEDVDASFARAVEAGAQVLAEPELAYWGERCATLSDPMGHVWTLATRVEALTPAQIAARAAASAEEAAPERTEEAGAAEGETPASEPADSPS